MNNSLMIALTFLLMEGATWVIHKYVMHGFLWVLHRDHHDHSSDGALERNDWFFVIFSIPAILLLFYGLKNGYTTEYYIGVGITLYGACYFLVHDIFIHQRIKIFTNTTNPYLLAIRRAHKQHHKHTGKEEGECFGFLWVPVKYYKFYFDKK